MNSNLRCQTNKKRSLQDAVDSFMMPWSHVRKAFQAHLGVKRMLLSIAEEQCAKNN